MNMLRKYKPNIYEPPNLVLVETHLESRGEAGYALLMKKGNLWFRSDGLTYAGYTPTSWAFIN